MVWNLLSSIIRPFQRLISVTGQGGVHEEREVHRLKFHDRFERVPTTLPSMNHGQFRRFIPPGECANFDVLDNSSIVELPSAVKADQCIKRWSKKTALTTSKFFSLRGQASDAAGLHKTLHSHETAQSLKTNQKQNAGRKISVIASTCAVSAFAKKSTSTGLLATMSPWLVGDVQLHAVVRSSGWFSSPRNRGRIHGSNITTRLSRLSSCGAWAGDCFLQA